MATITGAPLPPLRELASGPLARDREAFVARYASPVLMLPPDALGSAADLGESGTRRFDGADTDRELAVWVGFKNGADESGSPASVRVFLNRAKIHSGDAALCPVVKRSKEMPGWISIGRSPASDIVLAVETVSRVQGCFMEGAKGRWIFLDAASTNGLWHNGKRIGPRGVVELADGDELLLGPEVPAVWKTPGGLYDAVGLLLR